jgi:hypothetical protein
MRAGSLGWQIFDQPMAGSVSIIGRCAPSNTFMVQA